MAGALRYYEYGSDDGKRYGVRLDRTNSNATVVGGGQTLFDSPGATISGRMPQGMKPRYANAFSADNPLIKRKFRIGNTAAYVYLATNANPRLSTEDYPGQDDTPGVAQIWVVQSLVGEKILGIPNTTTTSGGLTN